MATDSFLIVQCISDQESFVYFELAAGTAIRIFDLPAPQLTCKNLIDWLLRGYQPVKVPSATGHWRMFKLQFSCVIRQAGGFFCVTRYS